jgi:hypothetical protein
MKIKYYYDPESKGFYQTDVNKIIPSSAIEISLEKKDELLKQESEGLSIVMKDGEVSYSLATLKPEEDSERFWRDRELIRADIELNKVQDSDPKAVGSVLDWRTYRKALRAWPEDKNFPKQEFRPKSPASKE